MAPHHARPQGNVVSARKRSRVQRRSSDYHSWKRKPAAMAQVGGPARGAGGGLQRDPSRLSAGEGLRRNPGAVLVSKWRKAIHCWAGEPVDTGGKAHSVFRKRRRAQA